MKLKNRSFHVAIIVLTVFALSACGNARTCRNPTAPPSYAGDVKAIVAVKCENCHSSTVKGADRHGAGASLNYETYDKLKAYDQDAANRVASNSMPLADPGIPLLTNEEKDLFLQWVYCGSNP